MIANMNSKNRLVYNFSLIQNTVSIRHSDSSTTSNNCIIANNGFQPIFTSRVNFQIHGLYIMAKYTRRFISFSKNNVKSLKRTALVKNNKIIATKRDI